jgi:uncharacterized Zn finger protein (UPF0148 family)
VTAHECSGCGMPLFDGLRICEACRDAEAAREAAWQRQDITDDRDDGPSRFRRDLPRGYA